MVGRDTLEQRTSVDDAPSLQPVAIVVVDGGRVVRRVHAAGAPGLVIGRADEDGVDLALDDELVSRRHAELRWSQGAWKVRDLDSRNGTHVDGARLPAGGERRLAGDGFVRVGRSGVLLVRDGRGHDAPPADDGDRVTGPELARAFAAITAAAAQPSLLVLGESGTGKEAAARAFHAAGPRAAGPFVAVNAATVAASVAERLLFGARRGAYSGATDAPGYLQAAAGGTLFLDEVAELEPAVQAKLLRVLETREVVPVGATSGTVIDVGIVAATHADLEARVAAGQFRADLYYRLARPTVILPPLRARRADIPRLLGRALREVDAALEPHPRLIEAACLRPWPGNVRELLHAAAAAAERARAAGRDVVRPEDLDGGELLGDAAGPDRDASDRDAVAPAPTPDRERVVAALDAAGGNVSAAARALGLHRTQLYRLLERLGLRRDDA